jgi:hypothetical protein
MLRVRPAVGDRLFAESEGPLRRPRIVAEHITQSPAGRLVADEQGRGLDGQQGIEPCDHRLPGGQLSMSAQADDILGVKEQPRMLRGARDG